MHDPCILGIESSCDETAAAVVQAGSCILSNVVFSQFVTHRPYGGVVPELASREHLRAIIPVVRQALHEAQHSYQSIDAIAVTQGPGLAGALLVGISFAKALAFALQKPLIAVNHLEGHIHSVLLEAKQKLDSKIRFPILSLVVSGGHTHLHLARQKEQSWSYIPVGQTRDDAAGEAFDKVAKLLGLGYPGGPVIDALSPHGNAAAVSFVSAQIKKRLPQRENNKILSRQSSREQHPVTATEGESFDFSFSGIKTSVLRYVELHDMQRSIAARTEALAEMKQPKTGDILPLCDQPTLDLIASFQRAVVKALVDKTLAAARYTEAATLFVSGGVAANAELRSSFERPAAQEGLELFFPSRPLSTDNAAMIAAAAYPKFLARDFADPAFSAEAGLKLEG